jgi:hypothetical protein
LVTFCSFHYIFNSFENIYNPVKDMLKLYICISVFLKFNLIYLSYLFKIWQGDLTKYGWAHSFFFKHYGRGTDGKKISLTLVWSTNPFLGTRKHEKMGQYLNYCILNGRVQEDNQDKDWRHSAPTAWTMLMLWIMSKAWQEFIWPSLITIVLLFCLFYTLCFDIKDKKIYLMKQRIMK